ncbi:hypothetical protein AVV67_gp293 [Escherichia phage vB_EcoM_VR25]|uniref:Uncharacterized protein n=1 Tax=Escherichia phage vB_EcoM_VR25 TaxID=1567028 RepID=A0A0A7HG44_9CAUD|nr:hypothetical protein AVV67_gp293 [Escherichia phage vB_EcoM_VR25]AIZ02495.1 hypothetical protein VR25_151 [Escherichia phage vB_EcoM_VR25]
MNIKFGQTIPKGYVIEIETWENDGDNYKTQTIFGVEEQEIQQYKYILELFQGSHCNYPDKCGNSEWDVVKDLVIAHIESGVKSGQLTSEFINKTLCIENLENLVEGDNDQEFELLYSLQELLGEPVEYDSDFMRVVSWVKLYIIEEEIQIPNVKALDML